MESVEDNKLLDTKGFDKESEVDAKLKSNGNCCTEYVDSRLFDNVKDEVDAAKTKLSSSQSPAMKGKGLKKWRRIRRESGNETNSYFDSYRKRGIVTLPAVMKQKSEGSSSSTNAMSNVIGNVLDHIGQYRAFCAEMGPGFVSRADSENSDYRNSRSSTAASAPRMNPEFPVLGLGFKKDTSKNLSGINYGISVQSDQQEKRRNVTKKARGARIKKENSIFSIESDSRSFNFVFLQGADDHVGSGVRDHLADSIIPVHFAQEALEREVQKLRDVGKEETLSSDDCIHLQNKLEEAFVMIDLKNSKIAQLESTLNYYEEIKTAFEELVTQRMTAELEYFVILKTIENLKKSVHMTNIAVQQHKNKAAAMIREQVPSADEEETKEDSWKLRNSVCRYAYCFTIQAVLFLVVLYMFILQFSSKTVDVIPT